jgi:hypothetical protein
MRTNTIKYGMDWYQGHLCRNNELDLSKKLVFEGDVM